MSDILPFPENPSPSFNEPLRISSNLLDLKTKTNNCFKGVQKPPPHGPYSVRNPSINPPLPDSIIRLLDGDDSLKKLLLKKYTSSPPKPNAEPYDGTDKCIVWRGCRADQLVSIVKEGTAGGDFLDENTSAPQEKEALRQVGEISSLPEFTLDYRVAERFGRGNFIVVCQIEKKYLSEGSRSEQGVICFPSAPVTVLGWKHGPSFLKES